MDYTSYVADLASTLIYDPADAAFVQILPAIIEYAENRIYRELDLLSTRYADSTQTLTPGVRNFTLPAGFIVVEEVNVITPVGTQPAAGTRVPLTPTTLPAINTFWPSSNPSYAAVPTLYAMINNSTIAVGPWPDAAYTVEVVGTKRPTPLSASNTTTPLTSYVPDLFFAASMVFATGWQRDYGSQADDPKIAQSWETQYQALFQSANAESFRQKIQSSAWTPLATSPVATPTR